MSIVQVHCMQISKHSKDLEAFQFDLGKLISLILGYYYISSWAQANEFAYIKLKSPQVLTVLTNLHAVYLYNTHVKY